MSRVEERARHLNMRGMTPQGDESAICGLSGCASLVLYTPNNAQA